MRKESQQTERQGVRENKVRERERKKGRERGRDGQECEQAQATDNRVRRQRESETGRDKAE